MRARGKIIGLAVVGVVVLAASLRSIPAVRWRLELIRLKLTGELAWVSWPVAARAILPHRLPGALARHAGWAVGWPAEGGGACPVHWETPLGGFYGQASDKPALEDSVAELLVLRSYEHGMACIRSGDVVLDVGSYLGTFTQYALWKGARLVVAFEPAPVSIACFKRTFSGALQQGRVVLVEGAAWNTAGQLKFHVGDNRSGSAVSERGTLTVRAVTIDDVVEELGLARVDFIKMDIEGSERYALQGAARTLSRYHPRMALCTYHRADDPEVIPKTVHAACPGYKVKLSGGQAYFY